LPRPPAWIWALKTISLAPVKRNQRSEKRKRKKKKKKEKEKKIEKKGEDLARVCEATTQWIRMGACLLGVSNEKEEEEKGKRKEGNAKEDIKPSFFAAASASSGVCATMNLWVFTPYFSISALLWYSWRLRKRTCWELRT